MKRFFFSLLFILVAAFLVSQSNLVFSQTPTPIPRYGMCCNQFSGDCGACHENPSCGLGEDEFSCLPPWITPTPTNIPPPPPAFNPIGSIPGVGCGVPNDTTGANICCTPVKPDCNFGLLEVLQIIPGIGDWIRGAKAQCEKMVEFQAKYGNVKCLYGQEKYVGGSCLCTFEAATSAIPEIREMCKRYLGTSNPKEFEACDRCAANGFYTGIGCIPLTLEGLIGYLFTFGIGLGGVIALLCIIYSAFIMQTSSGNPERLKKAQENLTSCIMGLMLIIFAIFILRLISVDILKIPGISR